MSEKRKPEEDSESSKKAKVREERGHQEISPMITNPTNDDNENNTNELPKPKIIIPPGRLLFISIRTEKDVKKGVSKYITTNFWHNSGCIRYITSDYSKKRDAVNIEKRIFITVLKSTYEYEGLKTSNLYELFVRTSIFSQILESFPHQHVALTEEAMKLPFEEQPWFFGALSDEEVEQIISGAAGQTTMLLRSVGPTVWMHFSYSDRHKRKRIPPYKLAHNEILYYQLKNIPSPFYTGFYNNGVVKELPIFQFFRAVERGNLEEIKREFLEKSIDAQHPAFRRNCVLRAYLHKNEVAKDNGINWILDTQFPVKINLTLMTKLVTNYGTTVRAIERCWNMRTEEIDVGELINAILPQYGWSFGCTGNSFKISHTKKVLVHLAWRYGNDDNYFKALPAEIIESICRHEIDQSHWQEIVEFLLEKATSPIELNLKKRPIQRAAEIGKILCDNFMKFTVQSHINYLKREINEPYQYHSDQAWINMLVLFTEYIPKTISHLADNNTTVLNEDLGTLLHFCLKGTDKYKPIAMAPHTFKLLKLLLSYEPLRNYHATKCSVNCCVTSKDEFIRLHVPCFWQAIQHANIDAVSYLVRNKWMPLAPGSECPHSAAEFAIVCKHPNLVELLMPDK